MCLCHALFLNISSHLFTVMNPIAKPFFLLLLCFELSSAKSSLRAETVGVRGRAEERMIMNQYIKVLEEAGQLAKTAGDSPEVQFQALAVSLQNNESKSPLPFGLVEGGLPKGELSLLNDHVYQQNFVDIATDATGRAWAPGGKPNRADESMFKACVAIMREGDECFGTGVLVEGELVLTAAHIFKPRSGKAPPSHVWIGSRFPKNFPEEASDKEDDRGRGINVRVDALMIHPDYGHRQGNTSCDGYQSPLRNDLMLLRIAAAERSKIREVAQFIPEHEAFHQSIVTRAKKSVLAVGFGLNTMTQSGNTLPIWSNDRWKRQVSVALGSQDVSMYTMLHHTNENGMLRYYEMIAAMPHSAGGPNEEANGNTCSGDSGGPVYTIEGGTPYLVGIVSRGIKCKQECSEPGGIYTLLGPYIEWIRQAKRSSTAWLVYDD